MIIAYYCGTVYDTVNMWMFLILLQKAVHLRGAALQFAPFEFRMDHDVVLEAVKQDACDTCSTMSQCSSPQTETSPSLVQFFKSGLKRSKQFGPVHAMFPLCNHAMILWKDLGALAIFGLNRFDQWNLTAKGHGMMTRSRCIRCKIWLSWGLPTRVWVTWQQPSLWWYSDSRASVYISCQVEDMMRSSRKRLPTCKRPSTFLFSRWDRVIGSNQMH